MIPPDDSKLLLHSQQQEQQEQQLNMTVGQHLPPKVKTVMQQTTL